MRVAVLGIGTMGHAVAVRLLERGHAVSVWNRHPERTDDLREKGARVAIGIADAVGDNEVVLTLLTADDAVREVCLGHGGVRHALGAEAVLVDMSSVHPRTSREVAAAVGADRFVDAPILAGPATILGGTAGIVAGGEVATINGLQPLWTDLSAHVSHIGPAGSGATMKLVSNLLFLESLACLSEAVVLAQRAGIDESLLADFLRTSSAVPTGLHNRLDDVLHGDHDGWFSVSLGRKDLRLARELGQEQGAEMQVAAAADALYHQAELAGHGTDDVAAVVEAARSSLRRV
jgi:3-hydroxyisobutyrate dehydrogenase-like beta-hydroxyacid dehydrogenase